MGRLHTNPSSAKHVCKIVSNDFATPDTAQYRTASLHRRECVAWDRTRSRMAAKKKGTPTEGQATPLEEGPR